MTRTVAHVSRGSRRGGSHLATASGAVIALVVSLLTVVVPLAAPARADAGLPPLFVKTLGGPQHSEIYPGGLETSAMDNTLVIADTGNNQIAKYDLNGNQIWRIGSWGAGVGQFDNPRDVGVDSLGNIFVMDTRNSRIVKLDKDGSWLSTYDGAGTSLQVNFPVGGSVTNDVLYIADTGRKRVLAVRTSDWSVVREVVKNDPNGVNACQSFFDIRDADADSAGNIYVAGYSFNQIAKVTPGGACSFWGSTGGGNGQFRTPYGVRVAHDPVLDQDVLFVADALNFRVQEFTLNGNYLTQFGVEGTPGQQGTITTMRRVAVATDGTGDVWAADLWGFQVERYDRGRGVSYDWAQSIGSPLGASTDTSVFHEPRQIGIGPDGILNIIDTVHHRFVRMDSDGHIQQICGERASEGSTLGKFNWPRGLKVDTVTGQIWVADTKQNRVQIINPDCSGVEYVGTGAGSGLTQMDWPYALDIRETDRKAFIADTQNNRIVAYDVATRQAIGTYGSKGSNWGQMLNPQSIAIHPVTGRLLIADTDNNRIKVVATTDGINYTTERNIDRGFNHPEGISVDTLGRIYIADSGNDRVVILNSTFDVTAIFSGPDGGFAHPAQVTVDGDLVYVSDTYNDEVDVFTWDIPVQDAPAPTVRTLAGPSLAAMYGSGFDYDATTNQLVVADTGLDRILRYTLDGTKVSEFGSPGSADGQLESPRDAAVDGAGNIYVADAENNRIQKFDATGNHLWTRGTTGTCSDCLFTPIGVTWDPVNQQILVSSSSQDRIKAWDANGVFQWTSPDIGVNGPRDAARGPDGRIWVSDYSNHRIKAFVADAAGNWNTTPVVSVGGPGDGDLNFPYNMVWNAAGNRMYVADTGTGRIVVYDLSGGNWTYTTAWGGRCTAHPAPCPDPGSPGFEPGKFNHLRRVVLDGAGKVYGLDFWGNGIEVFNSNGTYASSIEGDTAPVPGFAQPYGVDVGPSGNVYVMERLNHRIQSLDGVGSYISSGGSRGTGAGKFSWPEAVAVADDGRVWAADTRGNNIQRWDPGLSGADLSIDGAQVGGFDHPTDLSFAPDGRLWIADSWKDRVVAYDPSTGTYGAPIGVGGIGDGQLKHPQGVAVSATNVYVADTDNNRIQMFTLTGQYVGQAGAGLAAPEGIATAPDGTLWVADTGNARIRHFDANLNDLGDGFGSLGTAEGKFDRPHSLVAANGFLYVADTYNHRVQKFRIGETTISLSVTADGSISNPGGVAPLYPGGGVSDGTNWYIADSGNSRVVRIDAARNVTVISATGWNDPRSIALDPDGVHLWVGDQSGANHQVVQITKTGTVVKQIDGTGLDGPWGLAVDSTGVYVADTYHDRIVKINPNTDAEIWSTTSVGGTALSRPRTVTIGSDGNLYAGDSDNDRVVSINKTTGAGLGSFAIDRPRALVSDGSGGLWIGDAKNYLLVHAQNNGTLIAATSAGYGTGPSQFRQQSGIFLDNGSVVVGDQWSFQLERFTVDGSGAPVYAETIGGTPPAAGGFNGPFGLTYGPGGELYVADWFNHRIEKFNANRSFATQWGTYGPVAGGLTFPRAVTVAANGTIVVTDSENNRLSLFNPSGSFINSIAPLSTGLGRPHETAIAADGTYWVADTDNNRLLRFDAAGIVLKTVTNGVSQPRGIAIDSAGDIFVANDGAADSITKYDDTGTLIGTIVNKGTGPGLLKDPHNISFGVVNDAEILFVADTGNDRVQIFGTSGTPISAFGAGTLDAPKGVALSPDGQTLAVSDHLHNSVTFWNVAQTPPAPPDTGAPDASVTVPVQNGVYQVATIGTISGTAIDDQSGVASVDVGIKDRDSGLWLQSNGSWASKVYRQAAILDVPGSTAVNWTATWTPMVGNFAVSVVTKDAVGNEDPTRPWIKFSTTLTTPDTQAPDGTVTVPANNQNFLLGTVNMAGTATDNVGIAQVLVAIKNKTTSQWWNGSTWQPTFAWAGNAALGSPGAPSTTWSFGWAAPGAGSYAVLVRADDTTGNIDPTKPFVSFSVTATAPDTQAPVPTTTVPTNNQSFPLGMVNTSGNATDNVGVTRVRVAIKNKTTNQWWNGATWQPTFVWASDAVLGSPGSPSTSWSYGFPASGAGSYGLMVRADDAAGNFTTNPFVNFTVS